MAELKPCPFCGGKATAFKDNYESTDKFKITDNHRYCEYCGARMDGELK